MPYTVVQQHIDPRELNVNITSASGQVFRWGPDEAQAQNVPTGLTINTAIPGGFTTCDSTLNRRPDLTYYDLDRFAPFTVTGPGGALVAFDGYLSQRPMNRGATYTFAPEAIGWSAHMTDDSSFSMVYIDRGLSTWQGAGTARQAWLLGASVNTGLFSSSVTADQGGNPAIQVTATGPLPAANSLIELWYDAGANNLIATVQGTNNVFQNLSTSDVNVLNGVFWSTNDQPGASFASGSNGDIARATAWAASLGVTRFVILRAGYDGSAGSAGVTYGYQFENVAVIGNHGLTLRLGPSGLSPGPDDGFYGADLVRDIISRAAPLLSTAGIQQDTFVVPQCVFNTPTDADTAVQAVNQYYQNDYGAYENRQFFWRPPATGTQWHVRLGDGVTIQDQGPQIETAVNGVVVSFTDAAGVTRYVGPPGYGGDATSSALQDLTSTNPCNEYGRKRWVLLQMQGVSTAAAAIDAGANYLAANLARTTAGSISVVGFAKDSNGREWPAWRIRSGDTIIIDDSADTSAHYILGTSYAHDSLTNALTIDAPPDSSSWLLQRLNVVVSALG